MAWETALDRLVLQQIHAAENGERRTQDVRQQILDLWQLAPNRPSTAFHLGYARTLLGVDLPEPDSQQATRWYVLGRLRGHDRRGERQWIADIIQDPQVLLGLLRDPLIASQSLPLVMRTLFLIGDLEQAIGAIDYLSTGAATPDQEVLVDAALTDLLTRLERREEEVEGQASTADILRRCLDLDAFGRLPADVQSRYYRALCVHLLRASAFDEVLALAQKARPLAAPNPRLRSGIDAMAALACMRLHDSAELEPDPKRPDRHLPLEHLEHVDEAPAEAAPEALFLRALLAFEVGEYPMAADLLERTLPNFRRVNGRDEVLIDRVRFFLAASLLATGEAKNVSKALRLMDQALDSVIPDLESFYPVHETLKRHDRKLALRFLDAVDIGRGTSPDQLLFVALEFVSLGEPEPAIQAAERVLHIAVDLDQRIEALRVVLTARNMCGDRVGARETYNEIRDLLSQRGAFDELEGLLKNEEFVGQALDHLEVKCELADLYEEMEDREYDKAQLQTSIARSLRARKDVESLQQALAILREVSIRFPELAQEDLGALEKLLEVSDEDPLDGEAGAQAIRALTEILGRHPRILVVGGNERQRRHHPKLSELGSSWGFESEWLAANYTSPQKTVRAIGERLDRGIDVLLLLHWNRHETTEPALELARKAGCPARTVHYAGFTSLQVSLTDMLQKQATISEPAAAASGGGGKKSKSRKSK